MVDEKRRPGRPRKRPRRGWAGGQQVLARYGVEHYQQMSARGNDAKRALAALRDPLDRLEDAHLKLARGALARLTAAAHDLGLTRSALIRLAIEDYLRACEAAQPLRK